MIAYILAILVGFSLGLLGGGGSILTVPILVYALGMDPKLSIALSLAIVGITSTIGMIGHWRKKNLNFKVVLAFAPAAMLGSFLGAKSTVYLSSQFQMLLFAVVMLGASIKMIKSSSAKDTSEAEAELKINYFLLTVQALGVGLLSGVVGVGGGFLIVPALVLAARISIKQAIGTSLAIIALNSFSGFSGYINLIEIPWEFLLKFSAFSCAGVLAGTLLVPHVSANKLKKGFAYFLVIMGIFILAKNAI